MDHFACKWMTDRGAENFQCWWSLTCLAHSFWQVCVSDHPLQELEQQFERERLSLEEQKTLLRQQLEELREELTSKLTAANEEVGHQTSLISNSCQSIKSLETQSYHSCKPRDLLTEHLLKTFSRKLVDKGVDDLEGEHSEHLSFLDLSSSSTVCWRSATQWCFVNRKSSPSWLWLNPHSQRCLFVVSPSATTWSGRLTFHWLEC